MLKLIRVIANYSLDQPGAIAILNEASIIKALLSLLEMSVNPDKPDSISDADDVLKSCLAALNNLMYFARDEFEPFVNECARSLTHVSRCNLILLLQLSHVRPLPTTPTKTFNHYGLES